MSNYLHFVMKCKCNSSFPSEGCVSVQTAETVPIVNLCPFSGQIMVLWHVGRSLPPDSVVMRRQLSETAAEMIKIHTHIRQAIIIFTKGDASGGYGYERGCNNYRSDKKGL